MTNLKTGKKNPDGASKEQIESHSKSPTKKYTRSLTPNILDLNPNIIKNFRTDKTEENGPDLH